MGKYGQFYGQLLTTNNFAKLFVCQLVVVAYRATLLPSRAPLSKSLKAKTASDLDENKMQSDEHSRTT